MSSGKAASTNRLSADDDDFDDDSDEEEDDDWEPAEERVDVLQLPPESLDAIVNIFQQQPVKDWAKFIAFSAEWEKLGPRVFARCVQKPRKLKVCLAALCRSVTELHRGVGGPPPRACCRPSRLRRPSSLPQLLCYARSRHCRLSGIP